MDRFSSFVESAQYLYVRIEPVTTSISATWAGGSLNIPTYMDFGAGT